MENNTEYCDCPYCRSGGETFSMVASRSADGSPIRIELACQATEGFSVFVLLTAMKKLGITIPDLQLGLSIMDLG